LKILKQDERIDGGIKQAGVKAGQISG